MKRFIQFWVFVFVLYFSDSVLAYDLVKITNNTEYTASGTVYYGDLDFIGVSLCSDDDYTVKPGKSWTASSRGECLVNKITSSLAGPSLHGEDTNVVKYKSSGTGYSKFRIQPYGGSYRVFSKSEWAKESDTTVDKSPGFYFTNKTDWPIAFSLEQVGCLYHGIVPKGGAIKRNTGAVWFTLRMHIQPDGVNPLTDWDCAQPIIEVVADVALAAMTGGSGAAAAGALKVAAKAAIKAGVKAAAKNIAKNQVKAMIVDMIDKSGRLSLWGQYAGYEWPFRCNTMPSYEVTGGPALTKDSLGNIYMAAGPALKVTKVNECGNDMMLGNPLSASADQPFNPPPILLETIVVGTPEPVPADLQLQRVVLQSFYDSTNGSNWSRSLGWLLTTGTECTWYGIFCNPQGRVIGIDLSGNNLQGRLPDNIGDLANLQFLNVSSNRLTGWLPNSTGNLAALRSLNLSGNHFNGSLPAILGNLSSLTELILNDNDFQGDIPSELGNLSMLQRLILTNNYFSGTLPQSVADLNISDIAFDPALAPLPVAVSQSDGGFKFSFTNREGNIPGTVTGIIKGLVDNQRDQTATAIILTSWPTGLPGALPELDVTSWSSQLSNKFDVVDGEIVSATFAAQDNSPDFSTFVLNSRLITNCCGTIENGLSFDNNVTVIGNEGIFDFTTFDLLLPPFKFSFRNTLGNTSGTVSGEIHGLVDNQIWQKATSVILTIWPRTLDGVVTELDFTSWAIQYANSFDVENGELVDATFSVRNADQTQAFALSAGYFSPIGSVNNVLTFDNYTTVTANDGAFDAITFGTLLQPFRFSFTNVHGNVPGTVQGIIRGLVDNQDGQIATSVELLSWPQGMVGSVPDNLDARSWNNYRNGFDVVDGKIVSAEFRSQDQGYSLYMNYDGTTVCCETLNTFLSFDFTEHSVGNTLGFEGLKFARLLEPLKFTFYNGEGNVDGPVSGVIRGLSPNQYGQAAGSAILTSWPEDLAGNIPANLDITDWTIGSFNSFDVVNGKVVGMALAGQEPGYAFSINQWLASNCCGALNNILSFDSSASSTGNTQGYGGVSIQPLLSRASLAASRVGRTLPEIERDALIAFYNATGGDTWSNNSGWLDSGGSECDWFGVTCVNNRVTGLGLSANNLSGTLPAVLSNLVLLETLNLENNKIEGEIPAQLGTLAFLRVLNLSNNKLTNSIPSELGNLKLLEILNLRGNQLSGSIPAGLGSLFQLTELWLDNNELSGYVPAEFGYLKELEILALRGNLLTGILPQSVEDLGLVYLTIDAEITPHKGAPGTRELLAYWKFDGDTLDSSGNGHHGVAGGAAGFSSGVVNQALDLRGGDGWVDVATPVLNDLPFCSISYWVKLASVEPGDPSDPCCNAIYAEDDATTRGVHNNFALYSEPDKFEWVVINSNKMIADIPPIDQWVHFVWTYATGNKSVNSRVYKDGVKVSESVEIGFSQYPNCGSGLASNIGAWDLNSDDGRSRFFDGQIDELKIFSRAIPTNEILRMSKEGEDPLFCGGFEGGEFGLCATP